MTLQQYSDCYDKFFIVVSQKSPINPAALLTISYLIILKRPEKRELLRYNNFFAIARDKKFKKFSTPFEGINSGIDLIVQNPKFAALKIGTLKANPIKQVEKLKTLLDIV